MSTICCLIVMQSSALTNYVEVQAINLRALMQFADNNTNYAFERVAWAETRFSAVDDSCSRT
jgi:hypothetical protein